MPSSKETTMTSMRATESLWMAPPPIWYLAIFGAMILVTVVAVIIARRAETRDVEDLRVVVEDELSEGRDSHDLPKAA